MDSQNQGNRQQQQSGTAVPRVNILSPLPPQLRQTLEPTVPAQPLQQTTPVTGSSPSVSPQSLPQLEEQQSNDDNTITSSTRTEGSHHSLSSTTTTTDEPAPIVKSKHTNDDLSFQKQLPISPQQCAALMALDLKGKSKYNELCFPFDTNPNVEITFKQSSQATVVEFRGKQDAVEAAFIYFETSMKSLNCNKAQVEIQVDRLKWAALNEKNPNLLQSIHGKYGVSLLYTNGHLTVREDPHGRSDAHQQQAAIGEVEMQLSKCTTCRLKPSLSLPLLASLKLKLSKDFPNSVVFEFDGLQYLCSELDEKNTKILEIIKHKTIVKYVNVSAKIIETVKNDDRLNDKAFDRVVVIFQERRISLKGFVIADVSAAKTILLESVGQLKLTKKALSCSSPIKAYIHHVLFERKMSEDHKILLSSLSVKVITDNNTVYLEGPPGAIENDEKKLIRELVPETLNCEVREFFCTRKFIPQIEKFFLTPLHKQYEFTHVISCASFEAADTDKPPQHKAYHDRSRPSSAHGITKKRNQSESEENGFTIMLFSTIEAEKFEKVVSTIKELNPQTVRFQVPRGSIEYLQKKKPSLESKHRLWIFFSPPKGDSVMVKLHGLRDCDVTACQEDMEQSVFITKRYYLDPRALQYLQTKCQSSIEELKGKCKAISLPPAEKEGTHKDQYILIKGKEAEIEHVTKKLDALVGPEQFKVEMVSFKSLKCVSYHWRSWIEKNSTGGNVIVKVTLCKGPAEGVAASQHTFAKSEVNALLNIEVFGNVINVDKVVESIKEKQDANSIQSELEIPSRKRIEVQNLIKDAGIQNLKVWLSIRGNKLLIIAPSFAQDDLENAKSLIKDHLDETSIKFKTITCESKLAFDIMLADRTKYLKKVNEAGQRDQVRIQITSAKQTIAFSGTQPGLDKMEPLVHKAISEAKKSITSKSIHVTSIQSPYLETNNFKEFCNEMRRKCQVEIGSNAVLIKARVGSLTVLVVKGDILEEDVDVIVNAANEDLDHIGGLAKAISDRAGPELQKECSRYVQQHGKIATGDAVCLGSGDLPFKNIIHAVAPRWFKGASHIEPILQNVVRKSIKAANEAGHSSIALPALGTGIFRIPIKSFAKAALEGIFAFTQRSNDAIINEVRIILDSDEACECLTNEVKQCKWLRVIPIDDSEAVASSTNKPQLGKIQPSPLITHRPLAYEALNLTVPQPLQPNYMQKPLDKEEWKWMNDSGQFQSYDAYTCSILSTAYQKNSAGSTMVFVNGALYDISFAAMEQTNCKTKHKRKIKCVRAHEELEAEGSEQGDAQWYYKGDTTQWEPYLPNDSAQLEAWYQLNNLQPTGSLQIGKFKYQFDLAQMTQTNIRTKTVREIKRSVNSSEDADSDADSDDFSAGEVKWYFQNDSSEFQPFESSDSAQLEEWFQVSPHSTHPGKLSISGNVYRFNFTAMEQTNITSRKTRKIKREEDDVHTRVKYESKTLKLRGNVKHMNEVELQVKSKLENCLSNESIDIPKSVKVETVQKIAWKYPVKVDIISPTQVKVSGVQHVLQQCVDKIKTEMIASLQVASQQSVSQIREPKEWQPQRQTVQLFSVNRGSQEWNKISTTFMETLTSATISKIERIQNKWLWEKYSQHKQMLHKKNKGNVNEKLLYHGTRGNDPALIYDSEEGFDMRFSNSGMWGQANYFAVNSSYSDRYAYQQASGYKQMFLAYVLTGDSYECVSNGSLKMPPEKSAPTYAQAAGDVNLKQLRYDTVSGHTNGSKVFMTYDNLKAYPAYLITYQPAPPPPVAPKRFGFF